MNNSPERMRPGQGDWSISASGDVQDVTVYKDGVTIVKDLFGVVFLGILAILLLIALQRAQARNRELLAQLSQQDRS